MKTVVQRYPKQELHVVLDNSSTHGTPEVKAWLAANPQVHFHYTPTSASWLNQVEGFFGILGKQSLGVTDFPSKSALREHLEAYMRSWNKYPTPFAWTKPAASHHQVTPPNAEAHLDGGALAASMRVRDCVSTPLEGARPNSARRGAGGSEYQFGQGNAANSQHAVRRWAASRRRRCRRRPARP